MTSTERRIILKRDEIQIWLNFHILVEQKTAALQIQDEAERDRQLIIAIDHGNEALHCDPDNRFVHVTAQIEAQIGHIYYRLLSEQDNKVYLMTTAQKHFRKMLHLAGKYGDCVENDLGEQWFIEGKQQLDELTVELERLTQEN